MNPTQRESRLPLGEFDPRVPCTAALMRVARFLAISKAKAFSASSPRGRMAREMVGSTDVGNTAFHSQLKMYKCETIAASNICSSESDESIQDPKSVATARQRATSPGAENSNMMSSTDIDTSRAVWDPSSCGRRGGEVELSTIVCSCYCCLARLVPSLWWLNLYEASAVHIHRVRQRGIKYCNHFSELEAALKCTDSRTSELKKDRNGVSDVQPPLGEGSKLPQGIWNRTSGETADRIACASDTKVLTPLEEMLESIFHVSSEVPRGLYPLHRLRNLRELRCDHSDIVDDDLHAIALCTSLVILSLKSCPRITDVSPLLPLAGHHHLRSLDLTNTAVRLADPDSAIAEDPGRNTHNSTENVGGSCRLQQKSGLEAFGGSLNELFLANCKHIDNYIFLRSLVHLTALDLTNTNELLLNIGSVKFCTVLQIITLRNYKGEDVTHTMSYGEDAHRDNSSQDTFYEIDDKGAVDSSGEDKKAQINDRLLNSDVRCFFCGLFEREIVRDSSGASLLPDDRRKKRPFNRRACMHWMRRFKSTKVETISSNLPQLTEETYSSPFPWITAVLAPPWQSAYLGLVKDGSIGFHNVSMDTEANESFFEATRDSSSETANPSFSVARQSTDGRLLISELPSLISCLPHTITEVNFSDTFLSGASLDFLLSRCPNVQRLVASRCACLRSIPSARVLGLQELASVTLKSRQQKEEKEQDRNESSGSPQPTRKESQFQSCEGKGPYMSSQNDLDEDDDSYGRLFGNPLASLTAFDTLTYVNFSHCPVTNEDIGIVQCMRFLEELNLSSCPYVSRLPFLKLMCRLNVLNVSETHVTDEEFVRVDLFLCLSVKELWVERCQGICDPFNLAHTLRFSLQTLRLGGTPASSTLEATRSKGVLSTAVRPRSDGDEEPESMTVRHVLQRPFSDTPKALGDWLLRHTLLESFSLMEKHPDGGDIPTTERTNAIPRGFSLEVFL